MSGVTPMRSRNAASGPTMRPTAGRRLSIRIRPLGDVGGPNDSGRKRDLVAGDPCGGCSGAAGWRQGPGSPAEVAMKKEAQRDAGRAPEPRTAERVRNVVLVGHAGAGKTTLVEALLARTGTIA